MARKKSTKPRKTVENYSIGRKAFKVPPTTLQSIRKLQNTTELLIPRLSFSRLVREVMMEYGSFQIQSEALKALQEATEMYMTILFEDANHCASHARRITVQPVDIALVMFLRGPSDPGHFM